MDQPFEFETSSAPGGEASFQEHEWGRRNFPARRPAGGFRPRPPAGRRPLPPIRPGRFRRPYVPVISTPFPVETPAPEESERIRWIQDCLNAVLGLQLTATGVMGPETRSAVRSFQRRQGLAPNGFVGAETENALRSACEGAARGEEGEIGPLSATLTWLTNPLNPAKPYLFTRKDAGRVTEGGLYIAVDTRRGGQILKVGTSRSFARNPFADQRYRDMEQIGRRPGLMFYLATFTLPPGRSGGGVMEMVEDTVARLLYRAGLKLPEHGRPYAVQPVVGTVSIRNVLPPPLRYLLPRAYGQEGYRKTGKDWKGQAVPGRASGARMPQSTATLHLTPTTYPNWELLPETGETASVHGAPCNCARCRMSRESPFSAEEEMELAAELLSVASEAELDQFLGKLVKKAWGGIKKAGKFVGRIAKPLGGVLRGVAKAALPFVGGALGSFIPIPGVGTALGSALGGALSKALEAESGVMSLEEREVEMARRFVRMAGAAARLAAAAAPDKDPVRQALAAVERAARGQLPASAAVPAPQGRWQRRGSDILALDV